MGIESKRSEGARMKPLSEQREERRARIVITLGVICGIWVAFCLFSYYILLNGTMSAAAWEATRAMLKLAGTVFLWIAATIILASVVWGVAWTIDRIFWPTTEAERREKSDGTRLESAAREQSPDKQP